MKLRLDAWREAERRRDGLAPGSPEWQEAESEVQSAAKVYHAEAAQAFTRFTEEEFQDRNPWPLRVDRRTSPSGEPVAEASLARGPQG